MGNENHFPPLSSMSRVSRKEFLDDFDEIADAMELSDIGIVITDDSGEDELVVILARWYQHDDR